MLTSTDKTEYDFYLQSTYPQFATLDPTSTSDPLLQQYNKERIYYRFVHGDFSSIKDDARKIQKVSIHEWTNPLLQNGSDLNFFRDTHTKPDMTNKINLEAVDVRHFKPNAPTFFYYPTDESVDTGFWSTNRFLIAMTHHPEYADEIINRTLLHWKRCIKADHLYEFLACAIDHYETKYKRKESIAPKLVHILQEINKDAENDFWLSMPLSLIERIRTISHHPPTTQTEAKNIHLLTILAMEIEEHCAEHRMAAIHRLVQYAETIDKQDKTNESESMKQELVMIVSERLPFRIFTAFLDRYRRYDWFLWAEYSVKWREEGLHWFLTKPSLSGVSLPEYSTPFVQHVLSAPIRYVQPQNKERNKEKNQMYQESVDLKPIRTFWYKHKIPIADHINFAATIKQFSPTAYYPFKVFYALLFLEILGDALPIADSHTTNAFILLLDQKKYHKGLLHIPSETELNTFPLSLESNSLRFKPLASLHPQLDNKYHPRELPFSLMPRKFTIEERDEYTKQMLLILYAYVFRVDDTGWEDHWSDYHTFVEPLSWDGFETWTSRAKLSLKMGNIGLFYHYIDNVNIATELTKPVMTSFIRCCLVARQYDTLTQLLTSFRRVVADKKISWWKPDVVWEWAMAFPNQAYLYHLLFPRNEKLPIHSSDNLLYQAPDRLSPSLFAYLWDFSNGSDMNDTKERLYWTIWLQHLWDKRHTIQWNDRIMNQVSLVLQQCKHNHISNIQGMNSLDFYLTPSIPSDIDLRWWMLLVDNGFDHVIYANEWRAQGDWRWSLGLYRIFQFQQTMHELRQPMNGDKYARPLIEQWYVMNSVSNNRDEKNKKNKNDKKDRYLPCGFHIIPVGHYYAYLTWLRALLTPLQIERMPNIRVSYTPIRSAFRQHQAFLMLHSLFPNSIMTIPTASTITPSSVMMLLCLYPRRNSWDDLIGILSDKAKLASHAASHIASHAASHIASQMAIALQVAFLRLHMPVSLMHAFYEKHPHWLVKDPGDELRAYANNDRLLSMDDKKEEKDDKETDKIEGVNEACYEPMAYYVWRHCRKQLIKCTTITAQQLPIEDWLRSQLHMEKTKETNDISDISPVSKDKAFMKLCIHAFYNMKHTTKHQ